MSIGLVLAVVPQDAADAAAQQRVLAPRSLAGYHLIACVIHRLIFGNAPERWPARAARRCADQPGQREVEGMGGQFWYERPGR